MSIKLMSEHNCGCDTCNFFEGEDFIDIPEGSDKKICHEVDEILLSSFIDRRIVWLNNNEKKDSI